jgi:hypothetical protein
MNRMQGRSRMIVLVVLAGTALSGPGCGQDDRGPTLSGGREVKAWLADLHDPKPQVRRQAVLKLGNVGDADPAALEGLGQALDDPDPLVRRDAVLAVAKFRQPGEAIKARVEAMSKSDEDPRVRDVSQRALPRLGIAGG